MFRTVQLPSGVVVPEGWEEGFDHNTGNVFYFNKRCVMICVVHNQDWRIFLGCASGGA